MSNEDTDMENKEDSEAWDQLCKKIREHAELIAAVPLPQKEMSNEDKELTKEEAIQAMKEEVPKENDPWHYPYDYVLKITNFVNTNTDEYVSMQQVDEVLFAANKCLNPERQ